MKTLTEVIKDLDRWMDSPDTELTLDSVSDAWEYLKRLQKIEDEYDELKDWWAEEHAENVPLSWDELKLMEGKPVWYEHEFWKGWIILGKVEQGVNCEMIPDREERWYIVKDGSAKAYRKERKRHRRTVLDERKRRACKNRKVFRNAEMRSQD